MLAPDNKSKTFSYTVYIQDKSSINTLDKFREEFELELMKNYHYKYCMTLGQISKLNLFRISSDAHETYLTYCVAKGQRMGDVKMYELNRNTGWSSIFKGGYL